MYSDIKANDLAVPNFDKWKENLKIEDLYCLGSLTGKEYVSLGCDNCPAKLDCEQSDIKSCWKRFLTWAMGLGNKPFIKKKIYICAPYRGNVAANIEKAKGYCRIVAQEGHTPVCTHTMYLGVFNDNEPTQRGMALECGIDLVTACDELWIFTEEISAGMAGEIEAAKKAGITVKTFLGGTKVEVEGGAECV